MAIQDTDYFLIDDAGVTKKVTALRLKDNLSGDFSSHKLMVNLSDYSCRFTYAGDLRSKILPSHWMMMERDGQVYKVNGTKVSDYFGPPPVATGEDITTSFWEISERFISSPYSDYSGGYDVSGVQTNFIGTGRIYIGVKITAMTTYYNDIPIAGVQVLRGDNLVESWIFYSSGGGTGSGWTTMNGQIGGSSSVGFPFTPAQASAYSYGSITTSKNANRFGLSSSTSSRYTGAWGGIADTYNTTIAPLGVAQISQVGNNYYVYREASGSQGYSGTAMRSPEFNFSGGEEIRVIHALTGYSGRAMNADDTLYIGVY